MAKQLKKLDVMKSSSTVKKVKTEAPVRVKTTQKKGVTLTESHYIDGEMVSGRMSSGKNSYPKGIPKGKLTSLSQKGGLKAEIAVPQKLSFFNVPKNKKNK